MQGGNKLRHPIVIRIKIGMVNVIFIKVLNFITVKLDSISLPTSTCFVLKVLLDPKCPSVFTLDQCPVFFLVCPIWLLIFIL